MIIVSLSVVAALVVASVIGRLLARAREEWSVEFPPPEVSFSEPRPAARRA
jgi:hypothetical protein